MTNENAETTNTVAALAAQGADAAPEKASSKKAASTKKGAAKSQKGAKGGKPKTAPPKKATTAKKAQSKHTEGFDPLKCSLCAERKLARRSVWSRPVASHRGLRRYSCPQLLGAHAPACLCTRLFTSSLNSASARPRARLDGLTDRVGVHQSVSPAPLTRVIVSGRLLVRPRKKTS